MNNTWKNKKTEKLFRAFLRLDTKEEMANFCRDLMTEPEILEFAARLEVAQKLSEGLPQRKVSKLTGVSIATVTRVNQWLQRGMGGYKLVLAKFKESDPTDLSNVFHHTQNSVA